MESSRTLGEELIVSKEKLMHALSNYQDQEALAELRLQIEGCLGIIK